MKWLNYHHLYYFREIANEGSISKASEKLLVGQPSLSHQLKQLEAAVGSPLFERKKRSLILTAAGKVALKYADEIFKKGEEFLHAVNSGALFDKSRYRLGALAGLPKSVICDLLDQVKDKDPNCLVSAFEAERDELIEKLLRFEIDLAVTNDPGEAMPEVYRKLMGKFDICVYGSKEFEGLKKDFPYSLNGVPVILPANRSRLGFQIDQRLAAWGVEYKVAAECQDSSVMETLAERGKGLVFLPENAGRPLEERGSLQKIGRLEGISEEIWLLSQERLVDNPLTDWLLNGSDDYGEAG